MALRSVMAVVAVGGQPYPVQWTQPPGLTEVLPVLEPGFARRCNQLRTTARGLVEAGALLLDPLARTAMRSAAVEAQRTRAAQWLRGVAAQPSR